VNYHTGAQVVVSATPLTIGAVAKHFGVSAWKIRRLFEAGILPEPGRVGSYRVIAPEALPEIEDALRRRGYLPNQGGPSNAA
jgi:DNA-binding transcriptional MerR regulator